MSEALPGMPPPPLAKPPANAAAVILFRRHLGASPSSAFEVFWLKRDKNLRFAGGFYAFPGGRMDSADAQVPVRGREGLDAQLTVTAARELFEETGILMARGAHRLTQDKLDIARRALLEEKLSFASLLTEASLTLDAADFPQAGRWITPPFMPVGRFDARFFLVEAPPSQHAAVWPGELSEGAWISPAQALARWDDGSALLHPPNWNAIDVMGRAPSVEAALEALRSPKHVTDFIAERLEFQHGVHLVPLKTATLPPATHTNAYVLGTGQLVIVDPGSTDANEVATLVRFVRAREQEGAKPLAIIASHHHGDHIGGLEATQRELKLPVWAHSQTADRLPVATDRLLADGDVLTLDGPLPMRWHVLHTPGHARGHVCLIDERSRAAVVGDMVAGVGTIVIDPPEGNMATYVRQLERLRSSSVRTLYPAHGPAIPNGADKLTEYLNHRAWREGRVVEALRKLGRATGHAVVPLAYSDVADFVFPIAERNVMAILQKLSDERVVAQEGETFSLRS